MKKPLAVVALTAATFLALGGAARADGRGVDFTVGVPVGGGYLTATNQNNGSNCAHRDQVKRKPATMAWYRA